MSLLHIINTGVPGVLFCHTSIMHAGLGLLAGRFIPPARARAHARPSPPSVCLKLEGPFIEGSGDSLSDSR